MVKINIPTIFIKQAKDNKYFWILCLSGNNKKPTCKSPTDYTELTRCRQGAMRFCKHLAASIRIKGCDEVLLIDEVGDQRKPKKMEY